MPNYIKISNTKNHTPLELIRDLRIRSTHYAQKAERLAQKKMAVDNRLAATSAVLAAIVSILLLLYLSKLLDETVVIVLSTLLSAAIGIVGVYRQHFCDGRISAHTMMVAQKFYRVREATKLVESTAAVEATSDQVLLARYKDINDR